ncbi:MAG: glutamate--tRNA ligase, partial [Alphaproteobacteria bacterium]|nr:glutamate--tRNA ligase [Alphaproteobacteria bacterium]
SKRLGTLSVASLRDEMEIEPMTVNSLLAKLGTSESVAPRLSLEELAQEFAIDKISHATPKFDLEELSALNAKILHILPYAVARPKLEALGLGMIDESFWNVVRANLEKLSDIRQWWQVAQGPITPVIADAIFADAAAQALPAAPWNQDSWGQWTEAVKSKTGRKGKELFMPLRLALTGAESGPEMKALLPMIGPERVKARLAGKAA